VFCTSCDKLATCAAQNQSNKELVNSAKIKLKKFTDNVIMSTTFIVRLFLTKGALPRFISDLNLVILLTAEF
jgi:hypothetical protein